MTAEEVGDLFLNVQKVGKIVEKSYGAASLTISIQDGKAAGQTVYHVHVHIVPRKPGDWMNNDDIYADLDKNEKEQVSSRGVDNENRQARTEADMAVEAAKLRELLM